MIQSLARITAQGKISRDWVSPSPAPGRLHRILPAVPSLNLPQPRAAGGSWNKWKIPSPPSASSLSPCLLHGFHGNLELNRSPGRVNADCAARAEGELKESVIYTCTYGCAMSPELPGKQEQGSWGARGWREDKAQLWGTQRGFRSKNPSW